MYTLQVEVETLGPVDVHVSERDAGGVVARQARGGLQSCVVVAAPAFLLAHFENALRGEAQHDRRVAANEDDNNRFDEGRLPGNKVIERAVQCGSERQPRTQ